MVPACGCLSFSADAMADSQLSGDSLARSGCQGWLVLTTGRAALATLSSRNMAPEVAPFFAS